MKYANIKLNDIVDGDGICVSLWVQGCPHRCEGCHNQETWNFECGQDYTEKTLNYILDSISANEVQRNFSVLGGEPLCPENIKEVHATISAVKKKYPNIRIYLWTGYLLEELESRYDIITDSILWEIDYLIDGLFVLDKRDITLRLRGSSNQRIFTWDSSHKYFLQVE